MKKIITLIVMGMIICSYANNICVSIVPPDRTAWVIPSQKTPEQAKYYELKNEASSIYFKIPHNLIKKSWALNLKKLQEEINKTSYADTNKVDALIKKMNFIKRQARMNGVKI